MRYFEEDDDDEEAEEALVPRVQKLVSGINLKDLIDGKDVLFQINEDYDEPTEDPNLIDVEYEKITFDKLRGKRGLPHGCSSFSSISSSMISLDVHGYVKKEVISPGKGSSPPNHSRVIVHYNFYKESDEEPFDSTYLRGKPYRLYLDQGEIIPGLEMAIKSMKKGENSRFLIKWEAAFGKQGCPPRIGKECDILANITLMDYTVMIDSADVNGLTEEEISVATFEKTMKEAKNSHCSGNEEFASGDVKAAVKSYRKCINMLNGVRLANEEEEKKMLEMKVKCLVNLAICYNKTGRFEQACIVCRDALSIDHSNVKATFQYGKANLRLSNLGVAEKWLIKAQKMKPEDEDIVNELEKLHLKKESAQIEDTLFCQRAFGNVNSTSSDSKDNN